jgi:hypothetical protein
MFIGGLNWETTDRKYSDSSSDTFLIPIFTRVSEGILLSIW